MTNHYYCYRVYNMYRVGADPVKLNQQFYCRKRIIKNRLFHKGRMYWVSLDVLHKIHEIYRTMERHSSISHPPHHAPYRAL